MASTTNSLWIEHDLTNQKYLKCLAEGMKDWIDVKALTGNEEIAQYKDELQKEIIVSETLPTKILNKMKYLGIRKDLLLEFKEIFNKK